MNKRNLFRFFLMNQEPGAGGGAGAAGAAGTDGAAAGQGGAAAGDGAATGGAGAAAGAGAQGAQTHQSASDWLQSLADAEAKAYVEQKGWKDPAEAIKAMRELESKYAVPESPDAYQLPVPDGQDSAFAKQAAGWFHEAGVPAAAAKVIAEKWNAAVANAEALRQQQIQKEINALKSEWGAEFEGNVELGRRVLRTFGISGDVIDKVSGQMGDVQVLRLFHQIGKGLSEGTLNPGGSGGGNTAPVDPDAARAARMFPSMQPKT